MTRLFIASIAITCLSMAGCRCCRPTPATWVVPDGTYSAASYPAANVVETPYPQMTQPHLPFMQHLGALPYSGPVGEPICEPAFVSPQPQMMLPVEGTQRQGGYGYPAHPVAAPVNVDPVIPNVGGNTSGGQFHQPDSAAELLKPVAIGTSTDEQNSIANAIEAMNAELEKRQVR